MSAVSDVNQYFVIGRLTRNPVIERVGKGELCEFGFATTGRSRKTDKGDYEDEPCFWDCFAWVDGDRKGCPANIIEEYCRKGDRVHLQGRIVLDQWEDKETKQKRQKHKFEVFKIVLLEPKEDKGGRSRGRDDDDRGRGRGRDDDRGGRGRSRGRDDDDRGRGRDDDDRGRGRGRDDDRPNGGGGRDRDEGFGGGTGGGYGGDGDYKSQTDIPF